MCSSKGFFVENTGHTRVQTPGRIRSEKGGLWGRSWQDLNFGVAAKDAVGIRPVNSPIAPGTGQHSDGLRIAVVEEEALAGIQLGDLRQVLSTELEVEHV